MPNITCPNCQHGFELTDGDRKFQVEMAAGVRCRAGLAGSKDAGSRGD